MERLKAHEALDFCDRIKREKNVIFYILLSFLWVYITTKLTFFSRLAVDRYMRYNHRTIEIGGTGVEDYLLALSQYRKQEIAQHRIQQIPQHTDTQHEILGCDNLRRTYSDSCQTVVKEKFNPQKQEMEQSHSRNYNAIFSVKEPFHPLKSPQIKTQKTTPKPQFPGQSGTSRIP